MVEFINALSIKNDIEVWLSIAKVNRLNGDLDDAINVYDKVLSMDKNSFEAFKGKVQRVSGSPLSPELK